MNNSTQKIIGSLFFGILIVGLTAWLSWNLSFNSEKQSNQRTETTNELYTKLVREHQQLFQADELLELSVEKLSKTAEKHTTQLEKLSAKITGLEKQLTRMTTSSQVSSKDISSISQNTRTYCRPGTFSVQLISYFKITDALAFQDINNNRYPALRITQGERLSDGQEFYQLRCGCYSVQYEAEQVIQSLQKTKLSVAYLVKN